MYTIELDDDLGDILVAQARKHGLLAREYLRRVIKLALVADAVHERGGKIVIEDAQGQRELVF